MTLQNDMYLNTLINERPKHALNATHTRLHSAVKLNEELADYFRDRAQIEDLYVKSLQKLTRKHYISNKAALGTFVPMWEILYQEISTLCNIHSDYSNKILENIEQPLRQCMINNADYNQVQSMEDHLAKIAREYDELDAKIQKHKRAGPKGESKVVECTKQQEKKYQEWINEAPAYLQKHQAVDEYRWTVVKSLVQNFELLQQSALEKNLELTKTATAIIDPLSIEDEIAHFCSGNHREVGDSVSEYHLQHDAVVPEPSISESSLKHATSPTKKKRFFSTLVSIRRKPKSGHLQHTTDTQNRQRSLSHSGSLVESIHSHEHPINTNPGIEVATPQIRKAASFTTATMTQQQQQQQQDAPLIVVDSEGYSIPPPNRNHTWPSEASESLVDTEDMSSDAGSLFSNNANPRIRVDIKNESVVEEDASNAAVALSRVATLLKEKNAAPGTRRLRGRREVRSTQLYSVMEQPSSSPFLQSFEEVNEEEPDVALPAINVDVTERIFALSKSGHIEQAMIKGEVRIRYTGPRESTRPVCFQINLPSSAATELTDHIQLLTDNTYQLKSLITEKEMVIMTYQLDLTDLPLLIKPMWRCDQEKSRLLIKYQKQCAGTLENVVFITSVTGDVQHAQSIPPGELSLAHQRIRWDLGTLDHSEEANIKAQFETNSQGSPQPIAARFDLKDELYSHLQINQGFDPNVTWAQVNVINKSVKADKYIVA
ncbi:hypothetical protein BCV72DRAFT_338381 [Rhizopus microsporus var. microsporus]|uniref:MHD domain-containing protein n=2 Tax=Rhizopus microsporus TaxID=58291 RepID=A0A2G4SLN6_RHIZD|nr:uncharacterized protein RHIMIDRAFT_315248 [Rhizopus microsporus ATCC 52813]ORE02906.1 hypothetical protein BCV72DRAFT_338381 [Rhizopus microsporus var. microsporus]PHZ09680.1 hypothetical protein RHIMIDRAFT_315248 [Rhizopus microsporus ATCC 52813]